MSQVITDTFSDTSSPSPSLTLLTFKVAEQVYGLAVLDVMRIIEMVTITQLPDAPKHIQGIINLQGKTVPVMDLRQRFGLSKKAYGLHTPIILAEIAGDGRMLGLIVDTVEDVVEIPAKDLEMSETVVPAKLVNQMVTQTGHLAGVAKINRQMVLILNIWALLSPAEHVELSQALGDDGRMKSEDVR